MQNHIDYINNSNGITHMMMLIINGIAGIDFEHNSELEASVVIAVRKYN